MTVTVTELGGICMTTIEPRRVLYGTPPNLMINLSQIACVQNDEEGHAVVYLTSGKTVTATQNSVDDFWKLIGGDSEPYYTKQELLTRFKAGFETHLIDGFDTEMWRVNQSLTRDDELHLMLDAGPYDMTRVISDWNTDNFDIISDQILRKIGDLPIEVWLGDVKIKEAAE